MFINSVLTLKVLTLNSCILEIRSSVDTNLDPGPDYPAAIVIVSLALARRRAMSTRVRVLTFSHAHKSVPSTYLLPLRSI